MIGKAVKEAIGIFQSSSVLDNKTVFDLLCTAKTPEEIETLRVSFRKSAAFSNLYTIAPYDMDAVDGVLSALSGAFLSGKRLEDWRKRWGIVYPPIPSKGM